MEKEKQTVATNVMTALTVEGLEKAKDMGVEEFKNLFTKDTAKDIEFKKNISEETQAHQTFMTVSRGLGKAINELLAENEDLQKQWAEILKGLVTGEAGAKDVKKKAIYSKIPIISGWLKKRQDKKIENDILTVLPELLKGQWEITQKAADRVEAQKVLLKQAQNEAEDYYKQLGTDMIRLRKENEQKKGIFDASRAELAEIEKKLKRNEELESMVEKGEALPAGEKVLSAEEYETLINKRTSIIQIDNDREIALQTAIQMLRASKDGYYMTELQIGELTVTLKATNAISIMLNAYLKVTRPIMLRSITLINAQKDGIRAADLLSALGESMNHTLKMCAYGMTVMTEQAVMLGNQDFLKTTTVDEVKKIQAANDKVWSDFTKKQYDKVMEKAKPLLEHIDAAGSTEKQTV